MGSVMSCSKRKATSQDVESESVKRQKICSTNDDENCRLIRPDEFSWKHPLSFCANRVVNAVGFFAHFTKVRFQLDNEVSSSSLPSPPTSLSQNWIHHVFSSFHGADVRKTIHSHILELFQRKGIDIFVDNNIERSKSIGPELVKAIRGSKIAIVLLSKNYASSSWCLDELVEIMNCRKVSGQIVMPIFYQVDPTDIKKQTGDFGKAFRKSCKGKSKEHIERWRKALEDVATIAGEHSHKWVNDAAMIEQIATNISNMLSNSTPSRDLDDFVGMSAHIEEMERLLRLDSDPEVRTVGILGAPGIGKTTIATVLFNKYSSRFRHSAIMYDIRGSYPRLPLNGLSAQLQLQHQMLSQMIDQKDITISHSGVAQVRLEKKKVLLVIDDVDQVGQLEALAKKEWFGPGSRIIITTENLGVLQSHRIDHIYKVKFPSSDEAFEIFCTNAFGQKHPYKGFYELAWEVIALAGKLPLGLKVLGSFLRGRSKQDWKNMLPTLKNRLDGEIGSIIQFSYDALPDEEKYLFLYLACFFVSGFVSTFISTFISEVEEVLATKFLDVRQNLHVLAERSFISIEDSMIRMHTLLHQFGRKTSRKQFVHHVHRESYLLVGARDICEELRHDTTNSRRFISINLDLSNTEEELKISEKALERMNDLEFVRINDRGLGQTKSLQSLLHHSQHIRSLHWWYFPNICLPSTFNPEFLVKLDLSYSKLHKLWDGTASLGNLTSMNLSYSTHLKELPDLSTATNLVVLYLQLCVSLVELPSSIGKLTSLQILVLRTCSSLVKIPSSIGNLTNLDLDLTSCSKLVELPSSIGNGIKLSKLILDYCSSLVKLPSSINVTYLRELSLANCSRVVELPAIENANNLETLKLQNCSSLLELHPSIGTAKNLSRLDISGCSSLVELPSFIGNLQFLCDLIMGGCSKLEVLPTNINLEYLGLLDLTDCSQLKSFPEISTNIEYLMLKGTAIKEIPMSIMSWSGLSDFRMSYFESLKEFPHALDIITELHLLNEDIQEVPLWVKGMSRLRKLRLYNCNNLVSLPQLSDSLSWIDACNCESLERLDCSFENPEIRLKFTNCFKLNEEARDLIMQTSTSGYAILPGTQVPACFNHRTTAGGLLKIKLNELSLPTSLRFKACVIMDMDKEETDDDDDDDDDVDDDASWMGVTIDITDEQKDLNVWCLPPGPRNTKRFLAEHIYTFEIDEGEVTSTELIFDFKIDSDKWKMGECGLYQISEVPSC
ncbi:PREDICTED: probable disease resistance protein RPP1 isoform X2 [Camelina sativa]|uniref:ADP-ribosyl cyclase/cyclic ADP-ribose hydrolase n=1 Tax=Camelina sativa TaxID=90675 RepID=A0ABM1RMB6_CAMSA|nr:PREDICTED: probable disease resistance protein RPP1 isoform X2 [Camelina sativa]